LALSASAKTVKPPKTPALDAPILTIDTATKFDQRHRDAVAVCGSHGGVYPGYLAARTGLRALLAHDAGIGLDRAGIACLDYCQALGMAAVTSPTTARASATDEDMRRRGRISYVNRIAAALGYAPGPNVRHALAALIRAPPWRGDSPAYREGRPVVVDQAGKPRVVCIDSASMVEPEDAGQIVITGSHGALLASRPQLVLQVDALVALFNDAGIGIDGAGITRLPALDRRGIAAATVDAMAARIGNGLSLPGQRAVRERTRPRAGSARAPACARRISWPR
jgi:hypothetical protein